MANPFVIINMNESFSLDTKITRIRTIVEEMQKGVTDFDRQVSLFKEASELIKSCKEYLKNAETEVQVLINGEWQDKAENTSF